MFPAGWPGPFFNKNWVHKKHKKHKTLESNTSGGTIEEKHEINDNDPSSPTAILYITHQISNFRDLSHGVGPLGTVDWEGPSKKSRRG